MEGTVINNSTTMIQVYMVHTDTAHSVQPNIKNYQSGQISVVGGKRNADVSIEGNGKYIYCGVWTSDASKGMPNSWIIYSKDTGKIISTGFGSYTISVSGNSQHGWLITVDQRSTGTLLPILIAVFIILFIIGLSVGLYIAFKPKQPSMTTSFDTLVQ